MHFSKTTSTAVLSIVALGTLAGCNHKKKNQATGQVGTTDGAVTTNNVFTGPTTGGYITGMIVSVTPNKGPITGGTAVRLNGKLYALGAKVTFGGVQATDVVVVSANEITCKTPARTTAGAVTVEVLNTNMTKGRLINGFTYEASSGTPARIADYGDPTAGEQELLDLMNRARKDPVAEGQRVGLNFQGLYTAKPPLTHNEFLATAALGHVNDMVTRAFYGHVNPDGVNANGRVIDSKYDLANYFGTSRTVNLTENLGAATGNRFLTPQDVHDTFIKDEGLPIPKHREMILGGTGYEKMRETGLAYRTNQNTTQTFKHFVTEEFCYTKADKPFIVGTVFDDAQGDGVAQIGEGKSGVQVTLKHVASGFTLTTNTKTAGGYAFEILVPGDFEISINGQKTTVTIGANNVKVDLRGNAIVTQM